MIKFKNNREFKKQTHLKVQSRGEGKGVQWRRNLCTQHCEENCVRKGFNLSWCRSGVKRDSLGKEKEGGLGFHCASLHLSTRLLAEEGSTANKSQGKVLMAQL